MTMNCRLVCDKLKPALDAETWNAMDMEEESQFLDQSATISRVEQMLRAYHPSSAPNNGMSAVALSISAGVTTKYDEWGHDIPVEPEYAGPHVKWPLTLENVQQVMRPRLTSLAPRSFSLVLLPLLV